MKNYYEIIGINKTASISEIKAAYRTLALKWHPDRVPESQKKKAHERFCDIGEAYETLSKVDERKKYDLLYEANFEGKQSYEKHDYAKYEEDMRSYSTKAREHAERYASTPFDEFCDILGNILGEAVNTVADIFTETETIGNIQDGSYKKYDKNGMLRVQGTYKNAKLEGSYKVYYDNGTLAFDEIFKVGKKDGPYKKYDKNGTLREQGIFKDDKLEGSYQVYYENGMVSLEGSFRVGKKDGPYKMYDEKGTLREHGIFKDGKLDGPYKVYYDNGMLSLDGAFRAGKKDGPYKMYDEKGNLREQGIFKDGKLEEH